jgi:prepilin-type N-terminal cleavage/methylation domain-containing protein
MRERGFSLIELLIVVAIILVITGIAIPSYIRSRIASNESSAVYSIRTINTAQVTYAATYPTVGYATALSQLASPASGSANSANAGILDNVLGCPSATCQKSGYNFTITNTSGNPVSAYSIWGTPIAVGTSGQRGFCSDSLNPIMYDPLGGTSCTQPLE